MTSLAEIDVHDRLPLEARELVDHQGLVVVSRSTGSAGFSKPEIDKAVALAGHDSFSTLWLSAKIEVTNAQKCPSLLSLPVTLDQLARFISEIKKR